MTLIGRCECGNDKACKFTVTILSPYWSNRANSGLRGAYVNCLVCGRKSHRRQGTTHVDASSVAVRAWNDGLRFGGN
jgi:hypothetical protein